MLERFDGLVVCDTANAFVSAEEALDVCATGFGPLIPIDAKRWIPFPKRIVPFSERGD